MGRVNATRELAHETWSEYFDALSRELLDAPVSIEIIGAPGPPIVQASHLALLALSYDPRGDVFEVAVAGGGPRLPSVLRHSVEHPQRVSVDSQTMLAPITIAVDGPDDVCTVIAIEQEPETDHGQRGPVRSAHHWRRSEPQRDASDAGPVPEAQPADEFRPSERKAHAYARERGISPRLYGFVRLLAIAVLRAWFRVRVFGAERIPAEGPAIVAPNHKNFLDAFFIGIATRRHVRYMAKVELFKGPLAWLFPRLGGFPVRRGEADSEALETARTILRADGVVVVFPEGTRVEQADALGSPHHGAGRLALETGAPIVPAAITGTSHLWRGALPKVKRVQLTFLPTVAPEARPGHDAVSELIDERVWPAVQEEYGHLRAQPGVIVAALAAIGVGGGLLARWQLQARGKPRMLGKVEPRRLRRRKARARLWPRLRRPR